jgi:hypothetical protein
VAWDELILHAIWIRISQAFQDVALLFAVHCLLLLGKVDDALTHSKRT